MLISPKNKIVYENIYSYCLGCGNMKIIPEFSFFYYFFFPNELFDNKNGKGNFLILFVNFVNDYRINIRF